MKYNKETIEKVKELLLDREMDKDDDLAHYAYSIIKQLQEQLSLTDVSQQRELLDCPKCNKQHYISVPLVDKNTCQICKHEWQSYSG